MPTTPHIITAPRLALIVATSLLALGASACIGGQNVQATDVDSALRLMHAPAPGDCAKTDVDYGDDYAIFECGEISCDVRTVHGVDYYRCDREPSGIRDTWQMCVRAEDGRRRVLTKRECQMAAWMPGSSIGGF